MAVFSFADISEAFWKQRLHMSNCVQLCFLMDLSPTGQLTASEDPRNQLVCLRPNRSVMGISQSPVFLNLAKEDLAQQLDEVDKVLADQLRNCSYVDDLGIGLSQQELQQAKKNYYPEVQACRDTDCCKAEPAGAPLDESLLPPRPADEQRATRHLLRGEVGRDLTHRLAVRAARLELQLRRADMATRGFTSNLEAVLCPHYFNGVVMHYVKMLAKGNQPGVEDLKAVDIPEGYQSASPAVHKWYRPWEPRDPTATQPRLAAGAKEGDILRVLGPTGEGELTAEENQAIVDQYVVMTQLSFKQDVEIWHNKIRVDNPLLCDGDGPLNLLRDWYNQFYLDLTDVPKEQNQRTEWDWPGNQTG